MLIPPLFILILSAKRVPGIAVFIMGIVVSIIWAPLFQDTTLKETLNVAINGYVSNTGVESIDGLLSRGGILSMAFTVFVSLMTGMFAGLLTYFTILSVIMTKIKKHIKSAKDLIITVTVSCLTLMLGGAGQYPTLTIPGAAFRESFDELDVHSAVLSRTMEDTGTLVGSIIPWDVSAIFFSGILGVATLDYLPFAFLCLLSPLIAIVNGMLGIGIFRKDEKIKYTLGNYIRRRKVR
ncbi:Malate-2H(+)/Na(+)-lactate antiporter [subsurface metagenome]